MFMASSLEIPREEWLLAEMEMEDPVKMMVEDLMHPQPLSTAFGEDRQHCLFSESCSSYPTTVITHSSFDATTSKTTHWKSVATQNDFTTFPPNLLSFGNDTKQTFLSKENKRTSPRRRPPCSQEHVKAERKRRVKLTELFIALSALVPGLTKMDKATVLGDSIKYLKQLQERVRTLEEQTSNKTIVVRKFLAATESDLSSTDHEDFPTFADEQLPEIQARVSNKNVLIKIHCGKRKGVLVKALTEVEKLQLSIVSSSVMPFGTSTIDITILTQMDEEFSMAVKDVVKSLQSAFVKFM